MRQPECTWSTGQGAWRRLSIALALGAALAGCAGGDTRTASSGRDSPGRQAAITGTSLGQAYIRQGDYTVTATSQWVITWSGIGQTGTITMDLTRSADLTIGEAQVLRQ